MGRKKGRHRSSVRREERERERGKPAPRFLLTNDIFALFSGNFARVAFFRAFQFSLKPRGALARADADGAEAKKRWEISGLRGGWDDWLMIRPIYCAGGFLPLCMCVFFCNCRAWFCYFFRAFSSRRSLIIVSFLLGLLRKLLVGASEKSPWKNCLDFLLIKSFSASRSIRTHLSRAVVFQKLSFFFRQSSVSSFGRDN